MVEPKIQPDVRPTQYIMPDYTEKTRSWEEIKIKKEIIEFLTSEGQKKIKPSGIQDKVIPYLIDPKDNTSVAMQARNGEGKTLAFIIPIIPNLDKNLPPVVDNAWAPQAVIMVDTRILAQQEEKIIKQFFNWKDLGLEKCKVSLQIGSHDDNNPGEIILGTFEKVITLMESSKFKFCNLKYVVVDEADAVLEDEMKQLRFMTALSGSKNRQLRDDCRIILSSATFPFSTEELKENYKNNKILEYLGMKKLGEKFSFVEVKVAPEMLTLKNVRQFFVDARNTNPADFLSHMLCNLKNEVLDTFKYQTGILVFSNRKDWNVQVSDFLNNQEPPILCGVVQRDPRQSDLNERKKEDEMHQIVLGKMREYQLQVLVASDIIKRGLDLRQLKVVVNMDLPITMKKKEKKLDLSGYLHRVGRTGRFGDWGIAINVIKDEKDAQDYKLIEDHYNFKMEEYVFENFKNHFLQMKKVEDSQHK